MSAESVLTEARRWLGEEESRWIQGSFGAYHDGVSIQEEEELHPETTVCACLSGAVILAGKRLGRPWYETNKALYELANVLVHEGRGEIEDRDLAIDAIAQYNDRGDVDYHTAIAQLDRAISAWSA